MSALPVFFLLDKHSICIITVTVQLVKTSCNRLRYEQEQQGSAKQEKNSAIFPFVYISGIIEGLVGRISTKAANNMSVRIRYIKLYRRKEQEYIKWNI